MLKSQLMLVMVCMLDSLLDVVTSGGQGSMSGMLLQGVRARAQG